MLPTPTPGPEKTYTVDSLGDTPDAAPGNGTCADSSGACTLRAAVQESNGHFGDDTINFSVTGTINLTGALPNLAANLTINGPGAGLLAVRRDTGGDYRIFTISSTATANISGLTISNGRAPAGAAGTRGEKGESGGGIHNSGTLTLTAVAVTANRAGDGGFGSNPTSCCGARGGDGGGVYNSGTLKITDSTVSDNRTGAGGAAGGGFTVPGEAGDGGGIVNEDGTMTMANCTVSGNQARSGGGIWNLSGSAGASLKLTNSTITANSGTLHGSGVGAHGGETIGNTIIAGNSKHSSDIDGVATSQGHNIVGWDSGSPVNGRPSFTQPTDQVGTGDAPLDPRLSPLAANGGPTLTHALLANSPALDAGSNALAKDSTGNTLMTDQRGAGRFAGVSVDVGAYEFHPALEDVPDKMTNEDTTLSFLFSIGDAGVNVSSITASSDNQALVPDASLSVTGTGPVRRLQVTPAANQSGTANITLTVTESGGAVTSDTFLLTVTPSNDAPAFTKGADQTVGEDSGAQAVTSWATGISAGPPNESGQSLSFLVTGNTNPALFSAGPSVSPSGTLTYTPAAGASGSATITLVLKDDGGTAGGGQDTSAAQAFVINVNAVNDAPVNSVPGAQAISQNGQRVFWGPNSNNITVSDVDAGQNPVRVTLSATNGTLTLGSPGGVTFVSGDGTGDATMTFTGAITSVNIAMYGLVFRPTAGFSGAASIVITTDDQGHSGSGGALSDTDSVAITVTPGGTLQFSGATFEADEDDGVGVITVTRTGGSSGTASINYATSAGSATGGTFCVAGQDYSNQSGTLTWADGDAAPRTIGVGLCNDVMNEADETVNITLSGAAGSAGAGAQTTAVLTIHDDDPAGGRIEFTQNNYSIVEGPTARTVTVRRIGETTRAVTVDYSTDDGSLPAVSVPCSSTGGMALDRCDFTKAVGTLQFAAGETQKTFQVLIAEDTYVEGTESAALKLANPSGGARLGTLDTATLMILDNAPGTSGSAIDDDAKFVRQNYYDFLNRVPDVAGLQFWTNNITGCGANQGCREVKRIDTSAAFFLSVEFQETGFLVYRMYKTAYGDLPGKPVPLTLAEFLPDTQRIGRGVVVNATGWEQALEANTQAYAGEFAARARFTADYPSAMTPAQFVDALDANAGGPLSTSERDALVAELTAGTKTRAEVLRAVADDPDLRQAEKNRAFVLMQYFGYLRRNPNDAPETGLNFDGYIFWLGKLNEFGGDFRAAEMVKAFITSTEYRARFGQP